MTASPSAGEQRKFLANTIKPGGVAGVPESYYRKALDLNRFSNSVANKLLESYRRQIVKAVRALERIDKMPSSKKPQFKAARMRALIKQNLDAMKKWSGQSVEELIKQLDGLADIEVAFARAELQRVVPAAVKTQVRTVEVTESFAKAVVKADPLDVGTNLLQGSFEEAVKGPGSVMKLTARQGAVIRMPDGTSIVKAFRGLAERQGELFSRAVLDGLLTGESTESIARSLYGELGFSTEALTPRQVALAQKGNAWKMAKHQVRTLVRTSVNATSNAASLQVYKANPNLTKKYRWIATLDSNTTAICRNLDQKEFFYGKGPTPSNPPHFGCRSTTVPVVDYEGASKKFGVDIPPPSSKIGYRPTKEGTPSSADPKGGRVPVGTSAAQHLYDLRGTTKAGKKSRFDASPAQARMLNGGKATPGAFEKARYFNRLADRYGPEGAMKRFMREDGSEVSLRQLRSRYGEPDKITRGKKAAAPKPKPKPRAKPKPAPTPKPEQISPDVQRSFIEGHFFGQRQKLSNQDVADSLEIVAKEDSEVGRNFTKMLEFLRRKNISTVWSNGREKAFGRGPNFDHWKNDTLIQSMKDGVARAPDERGARIVGDVVKDLEKGQVSTFLNRFGSVSRGAAGHTVNGGGFIVLKQTSRQVKIKARELTRTKEAVLRSVEDAAAGKPKFVTNSDLYSVTGKTTVDTKDGWLATFVHEVGHQVHFNAGKPSISRSLMKANPDLRADKLSKLQLELEIRKANWVPSKYGATNGMEQFAETFVQYVFAPSALKKANPAAYSWINAALEEGLK